MGRRQADPSPAPRVAAVVRLEEERVVAAHVVLGGVSTVPRRAREAERVLLGAVPGPDVFASAAEAALEAARPLEHNRYKVRLARALVRRALAAVTEAPAT